MKFELKVQCPHEDANIECDFIEEGDLMDFYFRCPRCKREVVLILILKHPEEGS